MENQHEYGNQITAIHSDIKILQTDLNELRTDLYDDASDAVKRIGRVASEKLSNGSKALRQTGQHGTEVFTSEVKDHPLASILVATGLGLTIGALAMWSQSTAR